jgi:hypothetical protein
MKISEMMFEVDGINVLEANAWSPTTNYADTCPAGKLNKGSGDAWEESGSSQSLTNVELRSSNPLGISPSLSRQIRPCFVKTLFISMAKAAKRQINRV